MNTINTLLAPSGMYVLSPKGTLSVYLSPDIDHNRLRLDTELSAVLSEYIADLLKSYTANPDGSSARVAIVYNATEKKPWGHATFFMDEPVVREIYPVSGVLSGTVRNELTAFQKRNREKSVYRGIEVLLAHRAKSKQVLYCPVLFDRGTTLNGYLPMLGRDEQESDRKTPVLEVLNLVANVPMLERNSAAILELHEKLHAVLFNKFMRKDSGLALVETTAPVAGSRPTLGTKARRATAHPPALRFATLSQYR